MSRDWRWAIKARRVGTKRSYDYWSGNASAWGEATHAARLQMMRLEDRGTHAVLVVTIEPPEEQ